MLAKTQTVQQLIDELESLLEWFESDAVTVEQSVEKYETATRIAAEIEERLKVAKNQITIIKEKYSDT